MSRGKRCHGRRRYAAAYFYVDYIRFAAPPHRHRGRTRRRASDIARIQRQQRPVRLAATMSKSVDETVNVRLLVADVK